LVQAAWRRYPIAQTRANGHEESVRSGSYVVGLKLRSPALAGREAGAKVQAVGGPMYYFTITDDKDGYRARFYYNDELIWWTEGYSSVANAENAIAALRVHAASAPLR
jgi:uncharacterized protein